MKARTGAGIAGLLAIFGCHHPSPSSGWPAEAKRDFIQGCEAHSAHPKRCACAADALEKRTDWPTFHAMAEASKGGTAPNKDFGDLVKSVDAQCAKAERPVRKLPVPVKKAAPRGAPWK
jgi:hypothetical protein